MKSRGNFFGLDSGPLHICGIVKSLPSAADARHGPVDAVAVGARDRPAAHRGRQQRRGAPPSHGGPGHAEADAARAHDESAATSGRPRRPPAVARPQGSLKLWPFLVRAGWGCCQLV